MESANSSTVYTIEGNSSDRISQRSYSRSDGDIVGYTEPLGARDDEVDEVVDFSGDGNPDVLARHASNRDLYLFKGDGRGGFVGDAVVVGNNWSGYDVIFSPGDFTGDGSADVLARHASNRDLYLFKGNGRGGFTTDATMVGNNWSAYDRIF
ncbi:FG-GAP repeat domain-containing protein [Amycolatopsis aidingensis]|uniref:FG-GAP repeat domain-containing protein n=1 Tax=Amycolatopsis aidingensis TaxID=2842453 RepID=UPI001C0B63F9|nr:VCBS repeat-containing protein [Amycolatopsis aidingensis]